MNMHVVATVAVDLDPLVFKCQDLPLSLGLWMPDWAKYRLEFGVERLISAYAKYELFSQCSLTKHLLYNFSFSFNRQIQQHNMETIGEIVPFAKEMLNRRPSNGMLKIYMLGSSLAMLGVVCGLVETLRLPFVEQEPVEDTPAELIVEKKQEWKTTSVRPEVVDMLETVVMEVKATHLNAGQRSSANHSHAS